jgi:hypothetical protein
MQVMRSIQNSIYELRGERVMLDFDLAALHEVETEALNQAVKRNIQRFPDDFVLQISSLEWSSIWSQSVTTPWLTTEDQLIKRQSSRGYGLMLYAFTEQGIAMLSGVLRSERAVSMKHYRYAGFCGGAQNCFAST